jgi:PAS domain S-box-containing protein
MRRLGSEAVAGLGLEQGVRDAPVSIVVVDTSGAVIYSNGRAQELTSRQLGIEMPADLDRAIDIFHPDGRRYERHEWPAVRSLTAGEEIVDEEFFYALPDCASVWILCSSSPVRDEDGEVVAAVVAQADVTAQKAQERRLTYVAGLLDSSEDAIVAFDSQWFVTVWNGGAERLYGWTADEVLGRHTLEVVRTEMSHEERAEVRLAVADHGRWRGEMLAYRKDGAAVWVEVIVVALRGTQGEIAGYVAIHRDVTEHRRAMHGGRSERILESITDAFYLLDERWRFAYVNERGVQVLAGLLGTRMTRDDFLGESVWELFPAVLGTDTELNFRAAMRERRAIAYDYLYPATRTWFEIHVSPSDEGLSVYFRNIDDRKNAEAQLAKWARQQAVLADLGQRALAEDDVEGLLEDAVAAVVTTLGVELVAVVELLPGACQMLLRAGVGWRPGAVGRATSAVDRSFVGYARSAPRRSRSDHGSCRTARWPRSAARPVRSAPTRSTSCSLSRT